MSRGLLPPLETRSNHISNASQIVPIKERKRALMLPQRSWARSGEPQSRVVSRGAIICLGSSPQTLKTTRALFFSLQLSGMKAQVIPLVSRLTRCVVPNAKKGVCLLGW